MSVNIERDLEIRWKLLCIYYDELYSKDRSRPDPAYKLSQDEGIDYNIVNANVIYLIDEGLLHGDISYTTSGSIPSVSRIYSSGMKLVEKLYEKSQKNLDSQTKSKLDSIQSKAERVLTWIQLCIKGRKLAPEIIALIKDTPLVD